MYSRAILGVFALACVLCASGLAFSASTTSNSPTSNSPSNSVSNAIVVIPTTFQGFLNKYLGNATAANASITNTTYSGKAYSILRLPSGAYLIANLSVKGQFSFVLDEPTAYGVLRPYILNLYYPSQSTLSSLNSTFNNFVSASQGPMNDCLLETGLVNQQCYANESLVDCLQTSCQTIPVCSDALNNFGVPSPFATAIYNFSIAYQQLNSSYRQYTSLYSSINKNNIGSNLQQMDGLLSSISNVSTSLVDNPLFPGPTNYSVSYISQTCGNYGPLAGPWYCYATGFCLSNFNTSTLSSIQGQIGAILSSPVSNSSITSIADNATATAAYYYEPVYARDQNTRLNYLINSTKQPYDSLVSNISFISSRYKNASLAASFANLEATYAAILQAGINQNVTAAGSTLASAMQNASAIYSNVSSRYLPTYQLALNNTDLILISQLNYMSIPYSLTELASQQASINAQLSKQVNDTQLATIRQQLLGINSQAKSYSYTTPFSLAVLTKSIDGGLVSGLLSSSSNPIPVKLASAPVYVAMQDFVLGVVVLFVIYMLTYYRLKRNRKINMTPRAMRAWDMLFFVLFILVLIFTWVGYSYAQQANSFLPASSFISALPQHNATYILINNSITSNASVLQCASAVEGALKNAGHSVYVVGFGGYSCTLPTNKSVSGTSCFNRILAQNSPAIVMNQPTNTSLVYKGLFGTVLYANGHAIMGSSCPLYELIHG